MKGVSKMKDNKIKFSIDNYDEITEKAYKIRVYGYLLNLIKKILLIAKMVLCVNFAKIMSI